MLQTWDVLTDGKPASVLCGSRPSLCPLLLDSPACHVTMALLTVPTCTYSACQLDMRMLGPPKLLPWASFCCDPHELAMCGLPSWHLHMAFGSLAEQCRSAMCRRWMESWSATTRTMPPWI